MSWPCDPNLDDSNVQNEVLDGLLAAKQYESNKPQPSVTEQETMLNMNFPQLRPGDTARRLSEDECEQLRTSLQDAASEQTTRSIANLREQLTEHHALLDKLSSMTAKSEALEKRCLERDDRIKMLEQEVDTLKQSHRKLCNARRVSGTSFQVGAVAMVGSPQLYPQPQVQVHSQQQMQPPSAPPFFQLGGSWNLNCQAPSPFNQGNEPPAMNYVVPQASYTSCEPFYGIQGNNQLAQVATQHISTSPSCQFSSSDSFNQFTLGVNQQNVSGLSPTRVKRAISDEYFNSSSGIGMSSELMLGSNKKFKTDLYQAQESTRQDCFSFQLPRAV